MGRNLILAIALILSLATLACRFSANLPIGEVNTGPTVTDEINVPLPQDSDAVSDIELAFGAGSLNLSPGAQGALVSGTATYNVPDFKPDVTVQGNQVRIEQLDGNIERFPTLGNDIENRWDLQFGQSPMRLALKAGAYQGEAELGGLPLQDLSIADGAAKARVSFSEPNPGEMDTLRYETGASQVTLAGLANANFQNMVFQSGAGDYELDFSGQLQRDASVEIRSGLSNLVIVVPRGTAARVSMEGGLSSVNTSGDWQASGSEYTLDGEGPTLTFRVDMGAGSVSLRNEAP
jgi:hypothetical protein